MPTKFRPYLTNVNGYLASIRVDLALATVAPMEQKPWLLWLWLYFQAPRPDGLSSSEEAPVLWKIEDAIIDSLNQKLAPIFFGCITTLGHREFYFYHSSAQDITPLVTSVLLDFPGYEFECGKQLDQEWNQYLNVLYPSEDQLDAIANGDVVEAMANEGDAHELPRAITHWLYFPSDVERTAFLPVARNAGFDRLDILPPNPEDPLAHGVTVTVTHGVTSAEMDPETRALRYLAAQAGGAYDGWEAQVTTPDPPLK